MFPRAVALSPPVLSNTVSHDYILRGSYVSLDLSKPIWSNGVAKMSARTEPGHHEVAHNEGCLASFTGGDEEKGQKNPAGSWHGCPEREKPCKCKAFATKYGERLWTRSPRRGVLIVAIWRTTGFCISRSSLYASHQALLYPEKCVKADLQHPDTLVQMWKSLSMLSKNIQLCLQNTWRCLQLSTFLWCLARSSYCFLSISTPVGSCPAYIIHFFGNEDILSVVCLQSAVRFRALKGSLQQ